MGASREEIERLEEMSEYWWWEEEEAFIQFYAPFFARPFAHRSPSAGRATREPSPEALARWDMDGRGDLEHQPRGLLPRLLDAIRRWPTGVRRAIPGAATQVGRSNGSGS